MSRNVVKRYITRALNAKAYGVLHTAVFPWWNHVAGVAEK
jgi:hypothetical protein